MNAEKYLNDFDTLFIICLCIFFIVASATMFILARLTFKQGYEEAVKDFYNGKLKCDIVNEQVVWKN